MNTTQENGLNRELADEVAAEILATAAALQETAEKPSAKVFRTGISFEDYVKTEKGISIFAGIFLRKALRSKDPAGKVKKILDTAPDGHFYPNVKDILSDFWERDYGTPAS